MPIPENYQSSLNLLQTERAIKKVKDTFEHRLAEALNLERVSAPRFLEVGNGLQDDLAGLQKPVSFETKARPKPAEIVHSLAKWKRQALALYGMKPDAGLYTDMDAIRKDEDVDDVHSIYVDQWDWEKVITEDLRNAEYLEETVRRIWSAVYLTLEEVKSAFPSITLELPPSVTFVHTEELYEKYPKLSPAERESREAQERGAFFLTGIGAPLPEGPPHDARAADYDDWSSPGSQGRPGLNGDIIVWDAVRKESLELSSMGIRVNPEAMRRQLRDSGLSDRENLPFHQGVLNGTIPPSIGGGIGQSRLCMFLLEKAHIGEVQASLWPDSMINDCRKRGIFLL